MKTQRFPLPPPTEHAMNPNSRLARFPGAAEFVYLITAPELLRCKIGYTKNLDQRFNAIRQVAPTAIELVNYVPGNIDLERKLHREFRGLRRFGEWFDLDVSIVWRFHDLAKEAGCIEI